MLAKIRLFFMRAEHGSPREKNLLKWIGIITIVGFIIDQVSKTLAVRILPELPNQRYDIIEGIFDLRLAYNFGAAFGQFQGQGIALLVISAFVFIGAIIFYRKWTEKCPERFLSLGLLLSGILGNSVDRIFREPAAVVDFFFVHYKSFEWPIFNVADIAICVAVGLFILSTIFRKDESKLNAENEPVSEISHD